MLQRRRLLQIDRTRRVLLIDQERGLVLWAPEGRHREIGGS
jgi:hypothetical protein